MGLLATGSAYAYPGEQHSSYNLYYKAAYGTYCNVDLDTIADNAKINGGVDAEMDVGCHWQLALAGSSAKATLYPQDKVVNTWPSPWSTGVNNGYPILNLFQDSDEGGSFAYHWIYDAPPGDYWAVYTLVIKLGGSDYWTTYPSECSVTETYPYNRLECRWDHHYVTRTRYAP